MKMKNKEIYEVTNKEYKSFLRQLYTEDMITKEENDELFVYEKETNSLICSRTKESQNYIYNYPSRMKESTPVREIVLTEEESIEFFNLFKKEENNND